MEGTKIKRERQKKEGDTGVNCFVACANDLHI